MARLSPLAGLVRRARFSALLIADTEQFSASIPGIAYAFLGTSRQLSVAVEAFPSLLVGSAVQAALRADPHTLPEDHDAVGIAVATITTLQVGAFAFVLGLFRLGFIDVLLSRALLRGFITAIASVIAIEQFIPMFGLAELEHAQNPQTTVEKLLFLVENLVSHGHRPTILISFGALAVLIILRFMKAFFKRWSIINRLPEILLVVVASTGKPACSDSSATH